MEPDAAMTGAMTCRGKPGTHLLSLTIFLRISIPQFMVGFALGTAGYPFCLTLSASIFSKVVGGSSDPVNENDDYIRRSRLLSDIWSCLPVLLVPQYGQLATSIR